MKFLCIATKTTVEVYAWAQKPYSKFMQFKSFPDMPQKPILVDMVVEAPGRTKVLYASQMGEREKGGREGGEQERKGGGRGGRVGERERQKEKG